MIVVCGPEGSGTHLLTGLLRACGADAGQRSLPHAGVWWVDADGAPPFDPESGLPFPDGTRFGAIVRDPYCTLRSVMRRHLAPGFGPAEYARQEAVRRLASLPGIAVTYEALVADPRRVMGDLCRALDLSLPEQLPEVRDENAKWRDG